MAGGRAAFRVLLFLSFIGVISSFTNPSDTSALQALRAQWQDVPPSWKKSNDPCGATPDSAWEGITCNSVSRVTALELSSLGIKGKLDGDIGGLTELVSLDLSQNPELTGALSPRLGDLTKLNFLVLAQCGFTGTIPDELGNLAELAFLALNSNKLSGQIPASLGKLTKVNWLDLADNFLTGPIPVSSSTASGLDLLLEARHFHFNNNNLSGSIPRNLFSSGMNLIHVLFDGNDLTGEIPYALGVVKTLEVLRLDRNLLSGNVTTNLNNLTNINEMSLANNKLSGPFPDLTGMNSLSYVDLSNNLFAQSEVPSWFTTIQSLTTLIVEYGPFVGTVPQKLFSFPLLEQVKLKNNAFSGTLTMADNIGQKLQLVDLENNNITSATLGPSLKNSLVLVGNPICNGYLSNTPHCRAQQSNAATYSTSLASCGSKTCPRDQKMNPKSCTCAYPYEGSLTFRAPSFRELSDASLFQSLEQSLWVKLALPSGYVFLQDPMFNSFEYLEVDVALFPPGKVFTRSQILKIGGDLTNQAYKPPTMFGPYVFRALTYPFPENSGSSISLGAIIAIVVCCTFLVLGLIGAGVYALRQKKRADKAIELSKPFASWAPGGKDAGGAPQLKGARWFTYDELKKCTDGFSERSQIGAGGYGRVYRGTLTNGQLVAIKRAQQGSMQGGAEFRNEIELLSRVHHKNLVSLVGFCFEQGEQMLVYEFMPNGTLGESLSGKSGIILDWNRRLLLALGSARGLTYLHELADPPIIHRDIKTANILLDESLTAKVADFGLSKLVSDSEKGHVSTQVKGTFGYLDPEYYMTQQLTEKSDVYSFGVVMLELITAKQPIHKGMHVVREVRMAMDDDADEFLGMKSIIDPAIQNSNLYGFSKFLKLAMSCVEESADKRPTMGQVVKEIEKMLETEGLRSTPASSTTSASDFMIGNKGAPPSHPYSKDTMPLKDLSDSSGGFEYSGGYSYSTTVEPK